MAFTNFHKCRNNYYIHSFHFAEIFYIKCGTHETYYLKEEEDGSGMITATTELSEAKKFCISNPKNSNVIAIETFEETGPRKRLTYSVSRFSGKGHADSPPVLRENSDTYAQKLTLKDPRDPRGNKMNPNRWISEENMYLYIRCDQFGRKGKFCIQKINEVFKLTIVPKSEVHNGKDVLMLFCLEKVE